MYHAIPGFTSSGTVEKSNTSSWSWSNWEKAGDSGPSILLHREGSLLKYTLNNPFFFRSFSPTASSAESEQRCLWGVHYSDLLYIHNICCLVVTFLGKNIFHVNKRYFKSC